MTRIIAVCASLLLPAAAAAQVQISLDPSVDAERASSLRLSAPGARESEGWTLSGTWTLTPSLNVNVAWHDTRRSLSPVLAAPNLGTDAGYGYTIGFEQQHFGPFEVFGQVGVLDMRPDYTRDPTFKQLLDAAGNRVTIAGAAARWRPTGSEWGLEAGANRATGRPTFVGIGVFVDF